MPMVSVSLCVTSSAVVQAAPRLFFPLRFFSASITLAYISLMRIGVSSILLVVLPETKRDLPPPHPKTPLSFTHLRSFSLMWQLRQSQSGPFLIPWRVLHTWKLMGCFKNLNSPPQPALSFSFICHNAAAACHSPIGPVLFHWIFPTFRFPPGMFFA